MEKKKFVKSEIMEKILEGIYSEGKSIYTKALVNEKVYGERILEIKSEAYREWNPYKSKYCAGIKNGLNKNVFFKGATVLYLGSAEGTTVSHVSDIVEEEGIIFCVDISEIAMQKLTKLATKMENLFPILADAQNVGQYSSDVGKVDVLFQDISQRNQAEIFVKNSDALKKGCYGVLSLKTRSISSSESKKKILDAETKKLEEKFEIGQIVSLEPYEKEHYMILAKKK